MKSLLPSLLVTVLMLTFSVSLKAEDEVKGTDYYPLKIGTTWDYTVNGMKVTAKVAKYEKFGDVMCALVETSIGGNVAQTEHISTGKDGMYRYAANSIKVEPPALFLKLPHKKADSWKIDFKVGPAQTKVEYTYSEDEVKVPAGTYKTIITKTDKFKAGELEIEATIHYAKGVGMVKTTMNVNGTPVVMELEKFTLGK